MAVRFKLDENLPRDAETLLRNAGHDVRTALEQQLGGHPDASLLDVCRTENRVLVSFDLDFCDIRLYPPAGHSGIWILRPHTQSIENTLTLLRRALAVLQSEAVHARLWVIDPAQVRIRE
jgi:predicted nuclease of predicted toxin-antitoxin system